VIARGRIYWANLGEPMGSAPAKRRPVLVTQHDRLNRSTISTVVVAVVTSNTQAAEHPGNVFLPAAASGLPKDSVVNVSRLATLNKDQLEQQAGALPAYLLDDVDSGLRLILDL
jgi:mRNA interferase MazF